VRRPDPSQPTVAPPGRAPFLLRTMSADDLGEVMLIERLAFEHPWSADLFRRELEHSWSTILVAEEETAGRTRLLGFIIYWLVHDEIHVLNVASDPSQRRRGVARALMHECLSSGARSGARLATLEVRRSNVPAIDLYRSLGFRSAGVRANYYADEGEDAIVMLLDLP
jgi:ribosomal-protein-alanine N-acetyltransferase